MATFPDTLMLFATEFVIVPVHVTSPLTDQDGPAVVVNAIIPPTEFVTGPELIVLPPVRVIVPVFVTAPVSVAVWVPRVMVPALPVVPVTDSTLFPTARVWFAWTERFPWIVRAPVTVVVSVPELVTVKW